MKDTISKKLYCVLSGAIVLPFFLCSCSADISTSSADISAAAKAVIAKASSAEETLTASPDSSSQKSSDQARVPGLILSKCYLLESENYESIADGYYQAVLLTEESAGEFEALNTGLTELNKLIAEQCTKDFEKITADSKEYIAGSTASDETRPTGTLEYSIQPLRQDEQAVGFFTTCYSYVPGAAHGTTSFSGYTLDASTGSQISIDDVIKDRSALASAVNENLVFMGTGESAGDREESLMVDFASEDYFPSWVLSDNGILFRFAPEEIGTYEEGAIEAELSFSKYPDLFTDKYTAHSGPYTLPVSTVYTVSADLNEDGTNEKISLKARPDESGAENGYTAMRVCVGDKECLHECFFYTARGVLIHESKDRNYLYVQMVSDNDYPSICVFDLSGSSPVFKDELVGTGLTAAFRQEDAQSDVWYLDEQLISDPEFFSLDTRMNIMSTYSATMNYRLGSDGMPEPLSDQYKISNEIELTTLKDMTADTVDPSSGKVTKKGVSLPKGTKLRFYSTNGKDTVDLITEKGTVYRFNVAADKWPQTVNGEDLTEAFDGTMFAA